jgi:hypothetical protein
MIEDMRRRKFSPKTQNAYIRAVRRLAAFLSREEVARLIAAAGNLKYQAALSERVNDFETPGGIYLVSKDRVSCWRRSPVWVD